MQLDPDKKLEEQFKQYTELAAENKNIDVSTLMLNALEQEQENRLSKKWKRWAYILSFSLPPIGLIFAVKFWYSGKSDGKQAAIMCIAITGFILLATYLFFTILLSSAGISSVQQIQNQPQQLQQLLQ